jgi:hypothetical protein
VDRIAKKKATSWTNHFSPGDRPSGVTIDAWRAGSDDRAAARWSARDAKKWTDTRHGMSRLVGTLAFYSTNATTAGNIDHFIGRAGVEESISV